MKRVESCLWLLGIGLLAWTGVAQLDAHVFHHRTLAELARPREAVPATRGIDGHARERPQPGAPLGLLSIPRLEVAVAVAHGVSLGVLRRSVGHLPSSAGLGEEGNIVLAGHRDTHFRALERIEVGDRIELRASGGIESYVVEWIEIVPPHRVDVARDTPEPALTLITCYPFRILGRAPLRLVVRAVPVAPAAKVTASS